MAEAKGLGLLDRIRERRKEARQMGRLIHPEPLIAEIRRKKRIQVKLLALQRAGDFVEGVAKMLRDPLNWQSATASLIISQTLGSIIKL